MVLGHIIEGYFRAGALNEKALELLYQGLYDLIYSFHMPLFMMLSGYVFYTVYFHGQDVPDKRRIGQQIGNLIGVYLIFSIAIGLTKYIMGSAVNQEVTLKDIACIWYKPLPSFWYLYALIVLYGLFTVLLPRRIDRWVLLFGAAALALAGQLLDLGWIILERVSYYTLFFYIGICGRKYKNWIIGNKACTAVLFACSVVICVVFRGGHQDAPGLIQDLFGLSIVAALGTSLALWYLFERCSFFGENPLLCALGRHSLEIYVTHILFTAGCRIAFLKIGLENIYISLVLNLIVSISMPFFIAVLCEK